MRNPSGRTHNLSSIHTSRVDNQMGSEVLQFALGGGHVAHTTTILPGVLRHADEDEDAGRTKRSCL